MSYVISVYPILGLPQNMTEPISYFSKIDYPKYSIINIPYRNRIVLGLVSNTQAINKAKQSIKASHFSIKKILPQSINVILPSSLVSLLLQFSRYYMEPVGHILETILPPKLLNDIVISNTGKSELRNRNACLVTPLSQRKLYYRSRFNNLDKNEVLIVCCPTIRLTEYFTQAFAPPVAVFTIHGKLSRSKLKSVLHAISGLKNKYILFTTPTYAAQAILSAKLGIHVIIDSPESKYYIRTDRPRVDMRGILKKISADYVLSYEEIGSSPNILSFASSGDSINFIQPNILPSKIDLIDTSKSKTIVSESIMNRVAGSNTRSILFVSRKGYYTTLICADCGSLVRCPKCSGIISLYNNETRINFCKACNLYFNISVQCAACTSWNLRGYGIGTHLISDILAKRFAQRPVLVLDQSRSRSEKSRNKVVETFLHSDNAILVGTELLLEFPEIRADTICVVNLDNLFSIPDYSINSQIYSLLTRLHERGNREFIIQTKYPDQPLFRDFSKDNMLPFYLRELEDRKSGHLPPYYSIIRITFKSKNINKLKSLVSKTKDRLSKFTGTIQSYPSYSEASTYYVLLALNRSHWEKNANELRAALNSLDIAVDPLRIL